MQPPEDSLPLPSDPAAPTVRLAEWIQLVHADLVHANPTADNLDHPVSDVLMYDPMDEWTAADNRIILALGIMTGSDVFDDLARRAAETNAAAIIIKAHGAPMAAIRAATTGLRLAVLVAQDGADWTRLAALARASILGATADSVSGVRLGDLYAFANSVASLTHGAASIVDPVGRILGYSTLPGQPVDELRRTTTLALEEITPPAFDNDFQLVYRSPGAVLVRSGDEDFDRLAMAIRAGGELLGSIWIIDPGQERHKAVRTVLDKLAPVAGLHLLHARSASDFGERRNGDLMRTVMDDPGHASFAAAQLGVDSAEGLAVAAFSLARPDPMSLAGVRELQRLLHLVMTTCGIHFNTGHCALIDSVVYALLPCVGKEPRSAHRRLALEVLEHSRAISGYPVFAAVGDIAPEIADLPSSKSAALRTLQYLVSRTPASEPAQSTAALVEDFQAELSLLTVGAFISDNGLDAGSSIQRIRAHDAELDSDYLATLRAYLDLSGNISAIASRLHVHNNTVRYRVTRMVEDFGLDLASPEKRLWLWLCLVSDELAAGKAAGTSQA